MRRKPAILLFGDSITNYAWNTSPGAAGTGWYNAADALAAHKFGTPIQAGVGSDTLTNMIARIDTDVHAFDVPVVHVFGGANDIADSRDGAACVTDIETICDAILARGRKVILATMYPTTTTGASAPMTTELLEMNAGIRSYASGEANVHLVDFSAAMSSDGETIDDEAYLIDGVHPSKEGSALMAQTLAPVLTGMP